MLERKPPLRDFSPPERSSCSSASSVSSIAWACSGAIASGRPLRNSSVQKLISSRPFFCAHRGGISPPRQPELSIDLAMLARIEIAARLEGGNRRGLGVEVVLLGAADTNAR